VTRLRNVVVVCAGGFAVALSSLLLARAHPFGNAEIYASRRGAANYVPPAIMQHTDVPPAVRDMLIAKCADCHSAQTRAPIYGRFAPISWLMERDIVAARDAMNLSLWESYSAEQQEALKAEMIMQAKAHTMPPVQYRVIHWSATMTNTDITALTEWARGGSPNETVSIEQALTEGDAMRGRDIFQRRCTGCHAMEQDREGPRLRGVFGRSAGAVPGFDYSPALQQAHIVWNETTLERWLADPDALVPGNNMEFQVSKVQERRDLVRFLRDSASK
jgi:cytochrome c